MNPINKRKLYNNFPRLYRDAVKDNSMMMFGFDCNDGWFGLVYKLSDDIEAEAKALEAERIERLLSYQCSAI